MTFVVVFNVDGDPVGKQRPRFTKAGRTYTPKKTADYETLIKEQATAAMGASEPLKTPIAVFINVLHAIPISYSKKRVQDCLNQLEHPKKPDLDNVAKAYLDAMNGIVYKDDVQVVRLYVSKRYSMVSGVSVVVKESLE
jgi:Holliday junction resolvase RusA-like endonuclease